MHDYTHSAAHGEAPRTPLEELTALVHYMVHHNAAHAKELAGLAQQLAQAGNETAYQSVLRAVEEFERGNAHLADALQQLQV